MNLNELTQPAPTPFMAAVLGTPLAQAQAEPMVDRPASHSSCLTS